MARVYAVKLPILEATVCGAFVTESSSSRIIAPGPSFFGPSEWVLQRGGYVLRSFPPSEQSPRTETFKVDDLVYLSSTRVDHVPSCLEAVPFRVVSVTDMPLAEYQRRKEKFDKN